MRSNKAYTLVEIMIVVAVLGIVLAISLPTFFRARELARKRACQENQRQIESAKHQWAVEHNKSATDTPAWDTLLGVYEYLRSSPQCAANGTYSINNVNSDPNCSLSAQVPYRHNFEASVFEGS
jgi:prepilin-type N-terminal cleavage/methylation domain-containing protein